MDRGAALVVDQPVHQARRRRATETAVEIVVPVYNEATDLRHSIERLHGYLSQQFPLSWTITVADNASTDRTWEIACDLACALVGVRAVHLDRKGRGRALREVWSASPARVVAYMDVDLSTDLDALLPLVAPLVSGHSDVAIGTRLASGARVVRGPKRELISRTYNMLLKATMRSGFSDAQCGFKAVRADIARELLPMIEDQEWFFDTELLLLAEHNGLRIHEVPVDWVDDTDSRVDVVGTAAADLRGIWRMARRVATGGATLVRPVPAREVDAVAGSDRQLGGQIARFASIGIVSTIVFAALFVALSGPLGRFAADVVALTFCSLANTAANRRLTFSLRGRAGRARHYFAGLALGGLPLALTLLTLLVLAATGVTSLPAALVSLTAVNGLATLARFVLLRNWVFGSGSAA
jgi:glycosyltransferase involved in cell wall biosynthesis/putative flippase GtrA